MKLRKGFFISLLAVALVLCVFTLPKTVQAASTSDLTFTLNATGDGYIVSKCNLSATGELIIPDTYNGLPVTEIGRNAFYGCYYLASITIPNSITTIGDDAFSYCDNLTSITIPNSVTTIGEGVCAGCSKLTSLQVSEGNVVYHSAENCIIETASQTLIAGCNVSQIPSDGSVTGIGDYAFSHFSELTCITIPDSVVSIGDGSFYNCSNLASITIPNGVTTIGKVTFHNCFKLSSIIIPNSVTRIDDFAFYNCISLSSITLPTSITRIGKEAFFNCNNLTSISIPNKVTNIGAGAFKDCNNLSTVIYCGTQEQWDAINKDDNNEHLINATLQFHSYENNACTFCGLCDISVLAFELNYYGDGYVVSDCDAAASGELIIPDTYNGLPVAEIGEYALAGCSGLTRVVIPDSVTVIGYSAFSSSNYIEEIVLGNNVATIDMYAFQGCGITELTIPASVTRIGDQAFWQCNKLLAFWVDPQNPVFSSDENGVLYNKDKTKLVKVPVGFSGVYVVPETVTNLGDGLNHTNITGVVLPKSITSIPENAFYNCYFLESIVVPYGVTTIGRSAFYRCIRLTSIAIPNTIKSIGYNAFWNCSSLQNLIYCGTAEECQYLLQNENSMTGNMDLLYAKQTYHNYENCVCTICQATLHDWAEPTCTTPKTCNVCGATEGEALGHNYENGVCTACGAKSATVTVTTSKDTYCRGDMVLVTVGISPIQDCTSGGFLFNYDTNIFEYVSGEALVSGFGAAGISTEAGKLAGYFMNGQETVQGEIFQIVLRVKEDAVFSETDASQATITQKLTGTVSTGGSHLNVRSGASSACPIVHYLADGARVEILETKTVNGIEWGRINEGWISMKFVELDIVYGPGNTTISGEASFTSVDGTVHCSVSGTKVTIACKHSYSEWTYTSTVQRKRTCEICGDEDIEYAVQFQYADGTLIATAWYHNGDIVTAPQDPSIQEAGLAFTGWDKEITVCIGDAIYTAVFERVYFPGDINGDDTVTYNDAVYLLLHTLFGEDVYPLHKAPADIDGNGTVDLNDAVYLLLHTLFGESFYPLKTPISTEN